MKIRLFFILGVVFLEGATPLYEWLEQWIGQSDEWYNTVNLVASNIQVIIPLLLFSAVCKNILVRGMANSVAIGFGVNSIAALFMDLESYSDTYLKIGYVILGFAIGIPLAYRKSGKQKSYTYSKTGDNESNEENSIYTETRIGFHRKD